MSKQSNQLTELNLTELMAELDKIVAWFDSNEVDIEQATVKFDEGTKLAEAIKEKLATAENKVKQIKLKLAKITTD